MWAFIKAKIFSVLVGIGLLAAPIAPAPEVIPTVSPVAPVSVVAPTGAVTETPPHVTEKKSVVLPSKKSVVKNTKAVGGIDTGGISETLFAHVDSVSGLVDFVAVITAATLDKNGGWYVRGTLKPRNEWVQTSRDGSLRQNDASFGTKYDSKNDVFVTPKPTPNATLDATTSKWIIPAQDSVSVKNLQ